MYLVHIGAIWAHVITTTALFFTWVPPTYVYREDYLLDPVPSWAWENLVAASGVMMYACLTAVCACLIDREFKIEAERALAKDREDVDEYRSS